MHEVKLSRDTWRFPTHAPAVAFAVNVAGVIAVENVTAIELLAMGVLLFAGVVETTVGAFVHVGVLSQSVPPPCEHIVPSGTAGFEGTPAVHTSDVHWLLSTSTSALSLTVTTLPEPLHWFCLQSPGICDETGVPFAV